MKIYHFGTPDADRLKKRQRPAPFSLLEKVWLKIGRAQNTIVEAEKLITTTKMGKEYLDKSPKKALKGMKHLRKAKKELSLAMQEMGSKIEEPPPEVELELF